MSFPKAGNRVPCPIDNFLPPRPTILHLLLVNCCNVFNLEARVDEYYTAEKQRAVGFMTHISSNIWKQIEYIILKYLCRYSSIIETTPFFVQIVVPTPFTPFILSRTCPGHCWVMNMVRMGSFKYFVVLFSPLKLRFHLLSMTPFPSSRKRPFCCVYMLHSSLESDNQVSHLSEEFSNFRTISKCPVQEFADT